MAKLTDDYRVVESRILDIPNMGINRSASDDPRLFLYRGQLWMSWCAYEDASLGRTSKTSMVLCPLNGFDLGQMIVPFFPQQRAWEKNWCLFEHDDRLLCVYQIEPQHVVLEVDNGFCVRRSNLPLNITEVCGLARGGCPPLRRGDEYWSVYHGVRYADRKMQTDYAVGLYCFDAKEPFTPTRYLPFPLFDNEGWDILGNGMNENPRVVFPCGAEIRDGYLAISYGHHDRAIDIRHFDLAKIESHLKEIPR